MEKMLKTILEEINKVKSQLNKDDLLDDEIYYMNGNDGTEFDMCANDRLCEFGVFYKSEYYAIKFFVNLSGDCHYYLFDKDDPMKVLEEDHVEIYDINVHDLGWYMIDNYDNKQIWDSPIKLNEGE